MKCSDCGDTAEFRQSPHYKGAKLCPKNGGYDGAKPKKRDEKKEKPVRKIKQGEGDTSPSELTDRDDDSNAGSDHSCERTERAAEWNRHVSIFSKNGPRRQSECTLVIKQNKSYEGVNAFADTGSLFSVMTNRFAASCRLEFNEVGQPFDMLDLSGNKLPVIGYADVEIKTFGNDKYQKTRMVVIKGAAIELLLGRIDLRLLGIISANFPMRMSDLAINAERRARAKALIEMEDMETLGMEDADEEGSEPGVFKYETIIEPDNVTMDDTGTVTTEDEEMEEDEGDDAPSAKDIAWDQAAELHAEEEFSTMAKEAGSANLL